MPKPSERESLLPFETTSHEVQLLKHKSNEGENETFVLFKNKRIELNQLSALDWIVLNALYPNGPIAIS